MCVCVCVCVCMLVPQSCPTLWDSMNYSLPGSSVHGILQARTLDLVAIPFSRESSQPRDYWTQVSCIAGRFFNVWVTREALNTYIRMYICMYIYVCVYIYMPITNPGSPLGSKVYFQLPTWQLHLNASKAFQVCHVQNWTLNLSATQNNDFSSLQWMMLDSWSLKKKI